MVWRFFRPSTSSDRWRSGRRPRQLSRRSPASHSSFYSSACASICSSTANSRARSPSSTHSATTAAAASEYCGSPFASYYRCPTRRSAGALSCTLATRRLTTKFARTLSAALASPCLRASNLRAADAAGNLSQSGIRWRRSSLQAAGSLLLAAEAVCRHPPHILVDTTGLHFCLPLLRLLGVPSLACYVHYPIISSDMVGAVATRKAAHNNRGLVANLAILSYLKLLYYHLLVLCYRFAGRTSDVTMANGTWTCNHLIALWKVQPSIVFLPCDTIQLQSLPIDPPPPSVEECGTVLQAASAALPPSSSSSAAAGGSSGPRGRLILSVAQFRPEKDQQLQLRAFASLLTKWRAIGSPSPQPILVMAGAVRHSDDQARLEELMVLSEELGLISSLATEVSDLLRDVVEVIFAPNLKYGELIELLGHSAVGLHTMWNEHFGIGVVEMLAAGVATIAHNSGGPALDIITYGQTGLLASSETSMRRVWPR